MDSEKLKKSVLRHAAVAGAIIAFIIGIISFLGWWLGDLWRDHYKNVAIMHAIYLCVIFYLLWLILSRDAPDFLQTPKVRAIHDRNLLLVEDAPWLGLGVMAAIYTKENDYERLVCAGEVINVQANRLVQLSLRSAEEPSGSLEAAERKLAEISKDAILVRPGLFRRGGL